MVNEAVHEASASTSAAAAAGDGATEAVVAVDYNDFDNDWQLVAVAAAAAATGRDPHIPPPWTYSSVISPFVSFVTNVKRVSVDATIVEMYYAFAVIC